MPKRKDKVPEEERLTVILKEIDVYIQWMKKEEAKTKK